MIPFGFRMVSNSLANAVVRHDVEGFIIVAADISIPKCVALFLMAVSSPISVIETVFDFIDISAALRTLSSAQ